MTSMAALRFDPLLPWGVLVALAAVGLVLLGLAAWRRARGVVWRAACLAAVLGWLAGPRLVEETRQALPEVALLVVDRTASMAEGQRTALAEAARAKLLEEARALPGLELREVDVPEAGREGTRLFAAIARAAADIPRERLAGIVALTDGEIHDVPAANPYPGVPFHALIAARGEETDRLVRLIEAPGWGIVGKSVTLRYVVEDLGPTPREGTARVVLRRDGETVREEAVPLGVPQSLEVPVAHAGPEVVEIAADPLAGEISTANNRAAVAINGVRDRLRVLLISGAPTPGERAWRRLLKADPSVDLVHFTILRPPDRDDGTPLNELALIPFPTRELFQDKIGTFDLIVLDRFSPRGLLPPDYLGNIATRVRAGGALLVTAGPEFAAPGGLATSPLAEVLPARPARIVEEAFRPALTAIGQRHPVTAGLAGEASWGPWYRRIVPAATRGEALMAGPDGAPLLLLDRVGKGRVALLLSDQIWLWARGHAGGGPQAELLRRLAHWLMGEPELEEEALTAHLAGDRLVVERRSLAEDPAEEVTLTDPEGRQSRLALTTEGPGRATGTIAASAGVWSVADGARTAFAAIAPADPPEAADLRATAERLAPLARASGGSVHWLDPAGAPRLVRTAGSGADWIGLPPRGAHLVTGVAARPLLPAWLALCLILGLALLAWRREGG